MSKRFLKPFSILIVMVMLTLSFHQNSMAASLSDIPDRYSKEIDYLIGKKVISGYPDRTFRPNNNVTREEAATMIGQALGLDGTKRETKFKDVDKSSFASGYIQSAVQRGIIAGYDDGTFKPKGNITRGEVAYLLKPTFGLDKTSHVYFSDVGTNEHRYPFINALVTAGLAVGYPGGIYKPESPITRVEFALIVARGLNPDYRVKYEMQSIGERVVTADSLNVRSGPGTSYSRLGYLTKGTKIDIYHIEGDWVVINYQGSVGYVHKDYLELPSTGNPTPAPNPSPSPSGKNIIAIDAGHGGSDGGSAGNGLVEKEINLAVSLKVQKLLEGKGIQVVMTRSDDTFIPLEKRVEIAVAAKADTFVSIHSNSFTSGSANGTETYYSTASTRSRAEDSKQLATFIQNRLYKALETQNRGVKEAGYLVIKKNPLPAALVELGFVSNAEDAKKLGSEKYRDAAAEAIALGIVDYYNWKK